MLDKLGAIGAVLGGGCRTSDLETHLPDRRTIIAGAADKIGAETIRRSNFRRR
jgi:hypothetical protein